jgi:endonuclease/exonuclease/phosphatase family metal-dependent hydrolase
MRIATWNVERPTNATSPRSKRILARLREVDADIWILTETHDDISPGTAYSAWATKPVPEAPTRHRDGERRTIVWSRWPIKERIDEDISHRTSCVLLETPLGDLVIFGTIIPYHGRGCPPHGTLRRWEAHYAAIAVQGASWQRLRRKFAGCGLCVAGDFNQTREGRFSYGTKWGRTLLDLALENADLSDTTVPSLVAREEVDGSNWALANGVQPIDHIAISHAWAQRIQAIGAWTGKSANGYLSDHSGVWIDLRRIGRLSGKE